MTEVLKGVENAFYEARNADNAITMTAYMRHKFPFLGIPKPQRSSISRAFLRDKKKEKIIDWEFVNYFYSKKEREFHYLAIDYLKSMRKLLVADDLNRIEELIITNSWWDTVDCLDELTGDIVLKFERLKSDMIQWAESDNIWIRRVSIDFQLGYKDKTDTEVLATVILKNIDTTEFFINKAIGWSLREYSKTNKEWVREFVGKHKLSPLSLREASKYL